MRKSTHGNKTRYMSKNGLMVSENVIIVLKDLSLTRHSIFAAVCKLQLTCVGPTSWSLHRIIHFSNLVAKNDNFI